METKVKVLIELDGSTLNVETSNDATPYDVFAGVEFLLQKIRAIVISESVGISVDEAESLLLMGLPVKIDEEIVMVTLLRKVIDYLSEK